MLKTNIHTQTFTSQADGTKFTDHLTFEIIEDKEKDNHQIKICMISQFDIIEFICSIDKFSEAVAICSTLNHLSEQTSFSLKQQLQDLADHFIPTHWEN